MARIAVGGWQHETNTFAPVLASYENFVEADEWPGLAIGDKLFSTTQGVHLPITGALERLRQTDHELLPLLWCSARPSSYVTDDAFERISNILLDQIHLHMPLDGIYLDLHGAMVTHTYADGEGEILRRVRQLVGNEMPIAVSLDMHANVTENMVDLATVIDVYRTYPHIDMGETGARAASHLLRSLNGEQWHKSIRKTEFLIPLNWGCTWMEPTSSIYAGLPEVINDEVYAAAIAVGFHLSDIEQVGPAVVAYGRSQDTVDFATETLLESININRNNFKGEILPAKDAVAQAIEISSHADKPVILADTQDNPGGGGTGDTTGILRELIAQQVQDAVVAVIADAQVAAKSHQAGTGVMIDIELGDKSGMPGHFPLSVQAKVLNLGNGSFTATGPMYLGARMQLGPMALLDIEGIKVIVSSKKIQVADQSILRHLGIEPVKQKMIVLKSSVHFRNDFQDISQCVLLVKSPGAVIADPLELDYKNVSIKV